MVFTKENAAVFGAMKTEKKAVASRLNGKMFGGRGRPHLPAKSGGRQKLIKAIQSYGVAESLILLGILLEDQVPDEAASYAQMEEQAAGLDLDDLMDGIG